METVPVISDCIPITYHTDDVDVSFKVDFGKAKDSENYSEYLRTFYNTPYKIENFKIDNLDMYRLLAEEGPFVLSVYNIDVSSKKNIYRKDIFNGYIQYKYGITAVIDLNKNPEYSSSTSFIPSNDVERDGCPWFIKNNQNLRVDQNGKAKFQWSTAKALDKGVKPTPNQEEMGVEERHENSGMVYITFQPVYIEEVHIFDEVEDEDDEPPCRGFSGATRCITRGGPSSKAARVGYGSSATTKSTSANPIPIPNSRFILPIRLRVIDEKFNDKAKCAKNLSSAIRVEELQKNIASIPDMD